jgi:hypothetical protein
MGKEINWTQWALVRQITGTDTQHCSDQGKLLGVSTWRVNCLFMASFTIEAAYLCVLGRFQIVPKVYSLCPQGNKHSSLWVSCKYVRDSGVANRTLSSALAWGELRQSTCWPHCFQTPPSSSPSYVGRRLKNMQFGGPALQALSLT